MSAALDRPSFFNAVRANPFPGSLSATQVSGMEAILDACPPDLRTDALAYCLATAFHETARTMLPIAEYGRGKGKDYGSPVPPYGQAYYGRGLVQLTWAANYRRATTELRARGYLLATEDLERTPDLAMRSDVAAAILFIGSAEGWFTGKKLSDYFGPGKQDAVGARRIINGQDKASTIAGYFNAFCAALIAAGHVPGGVTKTAPVPRVQTKPIPVIPAAPAQPTGFWARLRELMNR